jgi:DNA-binding MarR family transcriptional regulator
MPLTAPSLFGTEMRTALLLLVAVLEETYPAEIAKHLGTTISSVQRTLDKLKDDGVIASRQRAVRSVTLNPA